MTKTLVIAAVVALMPVAHADQGSFTNSGGSASAGSGVSITSNVANPPGTLSLNCVGRQTGSCSGGSLTYLSTDGVTSINASFTNGTYSESCSGGGKGGHVTCSYSFTGYFSGALTVNGSTQAINGVTYQDFPTGGAGGSGTTAYNSAYTPFYYSDSEQIHRSDDLIGTNQISYGSQGSGVGQFYGAYGIAVDSSGRIYISDTYNCRIVRIDDMNGTNWTSYGGACGAGTGQFYDPAGIALDATGKIYVMDAGNSRIVRMDDMNGTNWVSYGWVGNGVGQFAQYLSSLAVDASGRIYVADSGNRRIVRFDDMTGTNWTALTQSVPVNGSSYSFNSPVAVAVDSAGRIYVIDDEYYAPALIRVDDMTGANWKSIYVSPSGSGGPNSIAVDVGGTVFAGGGGVKLIDGMAGVLNSSGNVIAPIGPYYVFGITPVPLPSPRPSAIGFSPSTLSFTQNVGTNASQSLTITNFGGSPLNLASISASGGFTATNNCSSVLAPATYCTVNVTFAPTATGEIEGSLIIADNSGNWGSSQTVILTGLGTAPAATLSPASLSFSTQLVGTTSNARNIILQNAGTGPMQVTTITATPPFSETNNCTTALVPGASCTIQVLFSPTVVGSASGTLTITDDAGTQTAALNGNGGAPVSFSSNSLSFGTVAVGNTSSAKTLTVTNRESAALTFTSIAASGGFTIASNTCGSSIAAGANCSIGITFSPVALGAVTGSLTFTDSALTSPQTVSLTGTGSAPVTLSSATLNFGTVTVGKPSSPKTVTLTNRLNAALAITNIAATAGFTVASNTCGTSVAAGASCTVGVTFSPTAAGAVTGTLTFAHSATNSPQTVGLTGTGR